ncbi:MAG TPA: acyltransferase [Chloroflexia bacterium]
MAARPTLAALTGLRFFAALHVVLFHFAAPVLASAPEWARNFAAAGLTGVDLFFILSGFVLAYNYLDGRQMRRREFWVARFARIYPAHLVGVLLLAPYIIYAYFTVFPAPAAAGKTLGDAGLALTLTQAWVPGSWSAWNGPAWSLGAEAFFYALFPFLGLALGRIPVRLLPVALGGFWVLAVLRPASYILYDIPGWWPVAYANPILRLPEFLMGIVLGRLFLHYGRARWGGWLAALGVCGWVGLLGIGVPGVNSLLARTVLARLNSALLYEALLLVFFVLLIYGLAHGYGVVAKGLSLPFMLLLGEASYGLYILQVPVAAAVKGLTEQRMDPVMLPYIKYFETVPYFLAYVAILVMLAIISHQVVEAPARTFLKRALNRPRPARVPAVSEPALPAPVVPPAIEAPEIP